MRQSAPKPGTGEAPARAWLYPAGNAIAVLALGAVLLSQAFNPDTRFQFVFMCAVTVAIIASYFTLRKRAAFGILRARPD
jgi:L-asparagine transporter-like permease